MSDEEQRSSLLGRAVNASLVPFRAATSKPAQRAYLGTFLLFVASVVLFGLSAVTYVLFYYSYVPQIGVTRAIHLQFGNGNPHGSVPLSSILVSQQPYDISLSLHLPRTKANLATGNFMVDLALLSPTPATSSPLELIQSTLVLDSGSTSVLGRSRRPAIMTHTSMVVDMAQTLANLPWLVLGWKKESETIEISMFEGVQFARGWKNIPDKVQAVIEAEERMQFYKVEINIKAQFSGLRWIMYNHRILSFLFFTSAFFSVSMTSAFGVYLFFTFFISSNDTHKEEPSVQIKPEDKETEKLVDPFSTSDLSDTPRSFPTIGSQRPLQFSRPMEEEAIVKEEDIERTTGLQPLVAEADDEEEFEDDASSAWRDSGIGTGREERDRRSTPRRRKSSQDR